MTAAVATHDPITLLNASHELLSNDVTLKRAARLLVKGKAVVHEGHDGRFLRHWPWPKVLILVKYVKIAADVLYRPPTVSRKGVLRRDGHRCAYCGRQANTIDHVVPRSRGGAMSWKNLVAACRTCNGAKGNRTPDEARMPLLRQPYTPKRFQLNFAG
ncbi:HNH endonuclease [Antricoccus suffuscus]|uniref:HNH endonuclease n=1 Tax=Antricoccus suffuscus TaxID=1629062 RepID=A0A2T0ZXX7_9ACTN|nr:HNH endonuclease [Antricoccus suffuscus]PRZ41212.1 HNH endonuclease [Antricoccus suffuscus]